MILAEIAYPVVNPNLIEFGPFLVAGLAFGPYPIRWYALSYIAALVLGWTLARHLVRRDALWGAVARPSVASIDDLLVYAALGVILGGRLGYVLFYDPRKFLAEPLEIPAVWNGGMAYHGGLAGCALGIWLFARREKVSALAVADICAAAAPLGSLFGRIANFIKPELWGRPTDVAWAMVFPGAGPAARHPSQLYEAATEGLLLFVVLNLAVRMGALKRPGLVTGMFGIGYGVARIFCEFFREPDPQLGFLFGGATMGMLLSVPLVLAGAAFLLVALRAPRQALA